MGLPLSTKEYYDNSGGLDLKSSPTKVAEDCASLSLNVDYSTDGAFLTRNGSKIQNVALGIPAQMAGAPTTSYLFDYQKSDGTAVQIIQAGTTIKTSIVTPVNAVTGLNAATPDIEFQVTSDDEYAIWGNGIDANLKFNGVTWTNLTLPRPAAPTLNALAAGVLPNGTYDYYVSFARTVGGVIVQESELSPVLPVVIGAGPNSNTLNMPLCVEALAAGVSAQCNARVLYRKKIATGVIVRVTAGATLADNVTLTYNDNIPDASLSEIEADFNAQATPKSGVFEEYEGRLVSVDAASPTDYLVSNRNDPWTSPELSRTLLDASITCIKRIFGALFIGTKRSWWVVNGDPAVTEPKRISSILGVINNRCVAGEDILYILASNRKIYSIHPTDFSQNEIRKEPLSILIEPLLNQISVAGEDQLCMEYYTAPNVSKVMIACPIGGVTNNHIIIYNETQSLRKQQPVWQYWDNINAAALRQMKVGGVAALYSGDYNGFIWKLDDTSIIADGAAYNGTTTSSTNNTLTDNAHPLDPWTVNAYVGMTVRIIDGIGADQVRTIVSNTADTLTVSAVWGTNPDVTSTYTIGGYDAYHFSNWKKVINTYDFLKQLWFIWVNANASGDYPIDLILQIDFDQTITNQKTLLLNLQSENAIWNAVIWGQFIWGSRSVFQDRIRDFERFRAIRVGFMNREAAQPFQINGFSLSVQDKGLLF